MIIPELTSHYTTIENDMDMDTYMDRAKDTEMATDKDMESACGHLWQDKDEASLAWTTSKISLGTTACQVWIQDLAKYCLLIFKEVNDGKQKRGFPVYKLGVIWDVLLFLLSNQLNPFGLKDTSRDGCSTAL